MRFACYSVEATSLAFWKRLQDEGHEVLVYIEEPLHKNVGLGIVPKTANYAEFVEWGRDGIYFFDCTNAGKRADLLRRSGRKVVGGGGFCDRLEKEREWGLDLAKSIGIAVPETKHFATVSDAAAYIRSNEGAYYFKPDKDIGTSNTCGADSSEELLSKLEDIATSSGNNIQNIVQVKLDGFALSTARWWNGHDFTGPFEGTIEHKALMNDDKGPATGCAFNYLWFYRDEFPEVARQLQFDKLGEVFRGYNAPPGIYDINALLNKEDGGAYFLEWTPRLGFDAEPTALKGILDLGKLLSILASGGDASECFSGSTAYGSVRLSVPPFPLDDAQVKYIPENKTCVNMKIEEVDGLWANSFLGYSVKFTDGALRVADPLGLVGLGVAAGRNPKVTFKAVYEAIDKYKIQNLQYRTDAAERVDEDIATMLTMGYEAF